MAESQNRIYKQTIPKSNLSMLTESSATISNSQPNELGGTTITNDNFLDICRCCIVNRGETNLFGPHFEKMPLSYLLKKCTNEDFQMVCFDDLPKSVCNVCRQLIIDSFIFVEKVRKAQVYIRELRNVLSSTHCEFEYDSLVFYDETTSLEEDTSLHEDTSLPKDISLREDTSLPKDISLNENTSLHEDVSFPENIIDDQAHLASLKSFEIKGLSKVHKELSEVLVENMGQSKKSIEPEKKEYSFPVKEMVIDLTDEIQKVDADDAPIEEEKNVVITFPILEVSEIYEEASDNEEIEVYNLQDGGTIEENLPILLTSDFDDSIIKNDDQSTGIGIEQVQCFECFETFPTKKSLTNHCRKTSHVNGMLLKCDLCSATFNKRYSYNDHVRRHKTNAATSICELCGATITTRNIKRHIESHSSTKNLICQFCGKSYNRWSHLQSHINTSHVNTSHSNVDIKSDMKLLCFLCGKSFKSLREFHSHLNVHHKDDDLENKIYSCELCGKYFMSTASLERHRKTRHRENDAGDIKIKKKYRYKRRCPTCFKMISAERFKKHWWIHENIKPYECEICQRQFRERTQLKRHMNIHLNLKPYECKYCKKRFRHATTLQVHVRSHTGETPYKCEFCEKPFAHSSAMKKHSLTHFKRKGKSDEKVTPISRKSPQKLI